MMGTVAHCLHPPSRSLAGVRPVIVSLLLALAGLLLPAASAAATPSSGPAAVTWGSNYFGRVLGAGFKDNFEDTPVGVLELNEITAVAAGYDKYFALLANGTVKGWGERDLGDGNNEPSGTPQAVLEEPKPGEKRELTNVKAVAAASNHGMALLANGTVMTWGEGNVGERGDGEYGSVEEADQRARQKHEADPPSRDVAALVTIKGRPLEHVKAIAAGGGGSDGASTDYALAQDGTTVWAWGQDSYGNLGIGEAKALPSCKKAYSPASVPCSPEPVEVKLSLAKGIEVTSIAAGGEAAYAVLSNGKVLAWGNNSNGELGTKKVATEGRPPEDTSDLPVAVQGLGGEVTSVSGGADFALARLSNGEVEGWGANTAGQLGGTSSEKCKRAGHACSKTAMPVEGLKEIAQVSASAGSSLFSLALNSSGTIYSLGRDDPWGQLGYGTVEGLDTCGGESSSCSRRPRAIEGISPEKLPPVLSVSAGEQGAVAIIKGGSAPQPPLRVEGEEKGKKLVLKLEWTGGSPRSTYFIRLSEEPPATNENIKKAREDWETVEAYESESVGSIKRGSEESEEPKESATAEQLEEEPKPPALNPGLALSLKELEKTAKNLETKAEREYMGPAHEVRPLKEGRGPCTVAKPCKDTIEEGINEGEPLRHHVYTVQLRPEPSINGVWEINGTP